MNLLSLVSSWRVASSLLVCACLTLTGCEGPFNPDLPDNGSATDGAATESNGSADDDQGAAGDNQSSNDDNSSAGDDSGGAAGDDNDATSNTDSDDAGTDNDAGNGSNAGSGDNTNNDDDTDTANDGDDNSTSGDDTAQNRQGRVYRQAIEVADTGDTVVFQVMEPSTVDPDKTYPLVLHSHGYGGSRSKTPTAFQQRLRDAGYYVVSIDERGFGDSSGQVRVMSPDFEGQDLIAVLDWAEDLDHLRRDSDNKMVVGSYGGSYGGMYQYLLAGVDPQQRLRVIAPDISPYDLTYSLNPHDVIKSGWALALIGAGEGGAQAGPLTGLSADTDPQTKLDQSLSRVENGAATRQAPVIYESLLRGGLTNNFPESAANLFRYHSLRYFCENEPAGPQDGFTLGMPDPRNVEPGGLPKLDALLTQGFRDSLFNFNDAYHSYRCLKNQGGDVRLLTHQSGHILPASLGTTGLQDPLDPFYAALSPPSFQDAGGSRSCGSLNLDNVTFAWFQQKLQDKKNALSSTLTTGDDVCLSLAEGDAIAVDQVKTGGKAYSIDDNTRALSGPLGVLGTSLGSEPRARLLQTQKLFTVSDNGLIMAGIPKLDVTIEPLVDTPDGVGDVTDAVGDLTDPLTGGSGSDSDTSDASSSEDCAAEAAPTNCDPILFFAIGKKKPGDERWDIIDDQITPVRGFGAHQLDMNGIAERLPAGEQVGLLIYGFHPQYPVTFSRDLFVPAVNLRGEVELPKLAPADIVREGV